MGKKNKSDRMFWESAKLNNATYLQYYNRLVELSTAMFEWKNLPDTVDPRFLELTLFAKGQAVFFKDEELGYLALPVSINGGWNVYNIPKKRMAYATNGYKNNLTDENSIIIFNNYTHTNSMLDAEMFSRRLYNMDRAIDININAQKTPILIQCTEHQRLTMMNLYKQYDGNEPFIFGDSNLDIKGFQVLNTNSPFVADKIRQEKIQTWNEALTYLGISNTNVTKKERLISDEVLRSQGGTIASRYSRLEMRRQACKEIAKMFPDLSEVWCDYRDDFREADDELVFTGDSGDGTVKTAAIDVRTN